MEAEDLLWKQYDQHINLYRSYLELVLKLNVFYYAITGAILSYYFTNHDTHLVKYSLILPLLMSIFFTIFLFRGARLSIISTGEINRLADELKIIIRPEAALLTHILYFFSFLMLVCTLGLIYLLICL